MTFDDANQGLLLNLWKLYEMDEHTIYSFDKKGIDGGFIKIEKDIVLVQFFSDEHKKKSRFKLISVKNLKSLKP